MSSGRACYSLPSPSRAEATAWLRKKLAMVRDEAPPPTPRPITDWVHGALRAELDELQPGMSVLVEVAGGETWVGDVRDVSETTLVLAPWGRGELLVECKSVRCIRLVPEHTWAEQRIVAERQRRGEPALEVTEPMKK